MDGKQTVSNLVCQIEGYLDYDLDAVVQVVKPVDGKLVGEFCHGKVSYCDCNNEKECLMVEFEPNDGKQLTILENADLYAEIEKYNTDLELSSAIKDCHAIAFHSLDHLGNKSIANTTSMDTAEIIRELHKLELLMTKYRNFLVTKYSNQEKE